MCVVHFLTVSGCGAESPCPWRGRPATVSTGRCSLVFECLFFLPAADSTWGVTEMSPRSHGLRIIVFCFYFFYETDRDRQASQWSHDAMILPASASLGRVRTCSCTGFEA